MILKLNNTYAGYYNYDPEHSPINQDFLRTEVNLDILHGCRSVDVNPIAEISKSLSIYS